MLKRILGKFRPTPSVVLSLLALIVALGSTGWAANGAAFVLGVATNSATAQTFLGANYNGTAMRLSNTSAGASATALTLTVAPTRPPMAVNSVVKVAKLNADYLDGLDSTALTRVRRIAFTLPGGTSTASIVLPVNLPVHVMGTGNPGIENNLGQATIVSSNGTLWWVGAESLAGESSAKGTSNHVGDHIVQLEFFDLSATGIDVEVNGGGAIRVRNTDTSTHSGELTLTW